MLLKSTANVDEILEVLNIFRYDMTDLQYDRARKVVLFKGALLSEEFNGVVRTEDQQKIVQFFTAMASGV